ncbi:DUF4291 family protein [Streptomyces sp. NPDC056930]
MTWIKPSILWRMYCCGWGTKEPSWRSRPSISPCCQVGRPQ